MLNRSFGRSSSNSFGCLAPVAALVIIGVALFVFKDRFPDATEAAQLVTPSPTVEPSATATATVEPTPTENYQGTASALSIEAQRAQLTAQAQDVERRAMYEWAEHEAQLTAIASESQARITISNTLASEALAAQVEIDKIAIQEAANRERERHYREMVKWIIIIPVILLAVLVFSVYLLLRPRPVEQYEDEQDEPEPQTYAIRTSDDGGVYIDADELAKLPADLLHDFAGKLVRDGYFRTSHWATIPRDRNGRKHFETLREIFVSYGLTNKDEAGQWPLTAEGQQAAKELSE